MRGRPTGLLSILLLGLATGCLTHMPPDEYPEHLRIRWRKSFDEARLEAKKTKKPILLITAAGDLTGYC